MMNQHVSDATIAPEVQTKHLPERMIRHAETIKPSSDELLRPEVRTIGPEVEIILSLVHLRGVLKKSYADPGANRPVPGLPK
jgi:hypothetical protein